MKACGCNLFLLVVYLSTTFAHGLSGLFQYDTWDVPSDRVFWVFGVCKIFEQALM